MTTARLGSEDEDEGSASASSRDRFAAPDALDMQLIDLLQIDGRTPFALLARQLGVTEKTVRRRVRQLTAQNFITIAAVTDPASLGFTCMGLALLAVDGSRPPKDIAASIASLDAADYVTVTTGEFPVQVELMGTSLPGLHTFLVEQVQSVVGVARVQFIPYVRLHYQQARFSQAGRGVGIRPRTLDETDRAIVSRLALDGRESFSDIADALGISDAKVRLRYGRLVESGAVRVMGIVNPLRLNYQFTSWVLLRVAPGGTATAIAEALTSLPSVSYVALTVGQCDILAEVVAATGDQLLSILDEEIRGIAGVGCLEAWPYVDLHYKAVRPPSRTDAHASDIQTV